jgi:hypothetical protein
MDPWAIAFAVLLFACSLVFYKEMIPLFLNTVYYAPIALLAFGFIADIISQSLKFSIGSLVGIFAGILNGFVMKVIANWGNANAFWDSIQSIGNRLRSAILSAPETAANAVQEVAQAAPVADAAARQAEYNAAFGLGGFQRGGDTGDDVFCSIPGLKGFDNKYAPQNILIVSTIMFYYMIGQWESQNGARTVAPSVALLITFGLQWGAMAYKDCLYHWWSPLVAFVGGAAFGIVSFQIVKAINGGNTPFIANQTGPTTPGGFSDVEAPVTDATKPADGSKCAEASGDDFVCDLYKNGELVSTTSS